MYDLNLKAAYFIQPHTLKVLRDVVVALADGEIAEVFAADTDIPQAKQEIDCGNAVVAPAFINSHAHLDLSHLRSMPLDGEHFGNWLSAVVASRAAPVSVIAAAAELTLHEVLATGCAGILDILATNQGALEVAKATLNSGLRAAIAVEILSPNPDAEDFMFGKTRELIAQVEQALLLHTGETEAAYRARLKAGERSPQVALSPHAPYSVSPNLYCKLAALSAEQAMLQTTHMNESTAEREFALSGGGALEPLYAAMGLDTSKMHWSAKDGLTTWIEAVLPSIIQGANETIHVHCYDLDAANVAQLGAHHQTVAYCPRSRRYFGHPPFRMRELLDAGARITLGTDSLGSTPNLNMLEEVAVARADLPPSVSNEEIFRAATTEGLRAVFRPKATDAELTSSGDLQVLRAPTKASEATLLEQIITQRPLCLATLVAGRVRFRHI